MRSITLIDALETAPGPHHSGGVIHYGNQGSQHASSAFGKDCQEANGRPSMRSVGDAYDNAMCESVFARLEREWLAPRPSSPPKP